MPSWNSKAKPPLFKTWEQLPHNRKTITSWSVNTPTVIAREERGTASLTARLKAAAKCESWGYPLAFHFDPIVLYDGCEKDYERTIKKIFSYVSPENIVWISLGSFRFMPALKPLVEKRFPKSKIIYGEFITGLDGKMRYFKPMRIKIYQKIITSIRKYAPDVLSIFVWKTKKSGINAWDYTADERVEVLNKCWMNRRLSIAA